MSKKPNEKKRRDPALKIYTANLLLESGFMTDTQFSTYVKLMCYQHQFDHMPEAIMEHYCKGDSIVMSKFIKDEYGLYYNQVVEIEMNRRSEVIQTKVDNRTGGKIKEKEKPVKEEIIPDNNMSYDEVS